jgi:hypothetical protein
MAYDEWYADGILGHHFRNRDFEGGPPAPSGLSQCAASGAPGEMRFRYWRDPGYVRNGRILNVTHTGLREAPPGGDLERK